MSRVSASSAAQAIDDQVKYLDTSARVARLGVLKQKMEFDQRLVRGAIAEPQHEYTAQGKRATRANGAGIDFRM